MQMSSRQRNKHLKAAQKLLPDAVPTGYALGRSGANPVVVVSAMIATVVMVCGGLFVMTGAFVLPGILPMLIVQHFISPPRGVVVAQQGVAVTKRSIWTGRPHDVVAMMGHGYTQPVEKALGRVKIMVGNEPVWMSTAEEAQLRQAFTGTPLPPQ